MKDPYKRRYFYLMLSIFGAVSLSIVVFFAVYRFEGIGDGLHKLADILAPFIYGGVVAYLLRPMCNHYEQFFSGLLPGKWKRLSNTLAVGLVCMMLFKKTAYTDGLVNLMINWFGGKSVDFIDGPYWAKMFVLCFYTIWIVMPFKVLILTSALASVDQNYYNAARIDGTSKFRIFTRITLPLISPMIFYLVITGFIGAFKAYSDAVALFGTDLNAAEMNTIVGYIYDMLYGNSGGYPSFASAAAIILFAIVLTITCINLIISKKHVHY